MKYKLYVSKRDISEVELNDLLAEIWEQGKEQPDTIVIRRSQIGKTIPSDTYYTVGEKATSVEIARNIGITTAQARKLVGHYQVKRLTEHVKEVQNPTHYGSDFGLHKLEIIE